MSEAREADALAGLLWPVERLGEAITALAFHGGLSRRAVENPGRPERLAHGEGRARWIRAAGQRIDVDLDTVTVLHREVDDFLRGPHVALLDQPGGMLALLGSRRGRCIVLAPDGRVRRVPVAAVRAAVLADREVGVREELARVLDSGGVPARRRRVAADRMTAQLCAEEPMFNAWCLRLPACAPFLRQLARAGHAWLLARLIGVHLLAYLLFVLSWWTIGVGVLQGRTSAGWLAAWAFLLLSTVPLRMLATWYQGRLAIGAGALLKRRLLFGSMQLEPDQVRQEGVGGLLGRIIESEETERLALGGGFRSAFAVVELVVAALVLAAGAAAGAHLVALVAWLALTAWLGWRLIQRRGAWTDHRLQLTETTVERMVGHRTRLAQASPARWHDGEDPALWSYLEQSKKLDRYLAALLVAVPRGFLIVGTLLLFPAFMAGASLGSLAISVGGLILAWQSLAGLAQGIDLLVGAHIAWQRVAPIFHAGARPAASAAPDLATMPSPGGEQPAIEASALYFRYPGQETPVLSGCDLRIRVGERILLEGPSGSGKSTLSSVLLGTRAPDTGLLLAGGLDRPSLGEDGWRRRVTAAPQFHENHVITETFAFNLLMGRSWPPTQDELGEAHDLCKLLGLGPLIARMPAGMLQVVGETGWQLSHGERSRLFIARALLQGSDVVILDESFAALDPENLVRALDCVRAHPIALIVIAHP